MATWAEHYAQEARTRRRAAHDAHLRRRHAAFDLQAQDTRMKYDRASFIVVTASEAYRDGWERIFGGAS